MASTKSRANTNPRNRLPQRFRPLYDQARTQSELRYGAQQAGFGSLLDQLTHDYGQQAAAQKAAGQSILGSLQGAGSQLSQTYAQAGLTPQLLANIQNSPTGQRLAGELASNQAAIQQQQLGAQAGQQYIQQHLADQYQQDVGKVRDQLQAMLRERGVFESSTLADLISGDRAARHAANVALAQQRHADEQAALGRSAAQTNALIGQGLLPDAQGNLSPLPGGKADPNAPGNQPKPKKPGKPSGADRSVGNDFRKAATWIKTIDASVKKNNPDGAKRRQVVQEILLKGDQQSGIPSISSVGLDAALDVYYNKALSPETVQALHDAGVKVKFLPGKPQTEAGRVASQRKINRPAAQKPPRNAPPGYTQPRPT